MDIGTDSIVIVLVAVAYGFFAAAEFALIKARGFRCSAAPPVLTSYRALRHPAIINSAYLCNRFPSGVTRISRFRRSNSRTPSWDSSIFNADTDRRLSQKQGLGSLLEMK